MFLKCYSDQYVKCHSPCARIHSCGRSAEKQSHAEKKLRRGFTWL